MNEDRPSRGFLATWFSRFRRPENKEPDDLQQLIKMLYGAEERHLIDQETRTMMEGALHVSEMQVRDIMLPRAEIVFLVEGVNPKKFVPTVVASGHSRFPFLDEKREQVIGILLAKDLLAYLAKAQEEIDIKDLIRKPVFVPESKRLNILLREFRTSRNHMAIVVDEYGGIAGLVSLEDVLEQIIGEIDDEHDLEDEEFIRRHRKNLYTVKARTPVDEFNNYFETEFDDDEYDTIGGLALKEFGHLPKRGESLRFGGFDFSVLRADPRRIHSLRVTRVDEQPSTSEAEQDSGVLSAKNGYR